MGYRNPAKRVFYGVRAVYPTKTLAVQFIALLFNA